MRRKQQGMAGQLGVLLLALALCAVLGAVGCQGTSEAVVSSEPTGAAFDPPKELVMPVISDDAGAIDTSHVAQGYVVARLSSAAKLKFQVSCGDMVYNYDLSNDGSAGVFPVNMGDGAYLFRIMKNTGGNDYVESERAEVDVKLDSEFAPFVIPNDFCRYDEASSCVAKAREVTADAANQGEAVQRVCEFVVGNIAYDTAKANELSGKTGYVPDPDATLASGTGICFDYASLGAAMLRSIGFPTKIITGYVSADGEADLYHAWIMVYVDGSWRTGEFSIGADEWSRVDLTFVAAGNSEFTGNGTSYTERYVY